MHYSKFDQEMNAWLKRWLSGRYENFKTKGGNSE